MRMKKLPFLVGVAIPSRGGRAQAKLKTADQDAAIRLALEELEKLFGGATAMKAPGIVRLLDGTTVIDVDQTVVVAGTTRTEYLKLKAGVAMVAEKVGKLLEQESVVVLAYSRSDGFILFL